MNFNLINVGIADCGISASPDILRTILGSCVGVCLYDPELMIGGMCHIMLPTCRDGSVSFKKYADSAIPLLLEDMEVRGGNRSRFTAKIIGGAKMFNVSERSIMGEIGNNNIVKVREVLNSLNIAIIAEDTGGNYGRTIDFYLETGEVKIKAMYRDEKTI
jgi:chemotaxis protein CheD